MNWYKVASDLTITGPHDGSGLITDDVPATYFTAVIDSENIGYILIIMPPQKNPYIGQVTIKPEFRLRGIATALYNKADEYLKNNKMLPLKPSRDLSPGSKKIWEKRLKSYY